MQYPPCDEADIPDEAFDYNKYYDGMDFPSDATDYDEFTVGESENDKPHKLFGIALPWWITALVLVLMWVFYYVL